MSGQAWAIKSNTGSYYQGRTAIGPMFGGTLEEAQQFYSEEEARRESHYSWKMDASGAEVVRIEATHD